VFSEAKTIWQTAGTHATRDFERNILFAQNGLCLAVFTDRLSLLEDCLSLFSPVAEKPLVEENQQTAAPTFALKERSLRTIECWDNGLAKQ